MPKVEDGDWNEWECDCRGCDVRFKVKKWPNPNLPHYCSKACKQRAYRLRISDAKRLKGWEKWSGKKGRIDEHGHIVKVLRAGKRVTQKKIRNRVTQNPQ